MCFHSYLVTPDVTFTAPVTSSDGSFRSYVFAGSFEPSLLVYVIMSWPNNWCPLDIICLVSFHAVSSCISLHCVRPQNSLCKTAWMGRLIRALAGCIYKYQNLMISDWFVLHFRVNITVPKRDFHSTRSMPIYGHLWRTLSSSCGSFEPDHENLVL